MKSITNPAHEIIGACIKGAVEHYRALADRGLIDGFTVIEANWPSHPPGKRAIDGAHADITLDGVRYHPADAWELCRFLQAQGDIDRLIEKTHFPLQPDTIRRGLALRPRVIPYGITDEVRATRIRRHGVWASEIQTSTRR